MSSTSNGVDRTASFFRAFLSNNAAGGIVLMIAAAVALIVANSPLGHSYEHILHTYIGGLSVLHWINDALMALFFLMVGLEIKREVLDGQLSSWESRVLPGLGALGGMVGPALIYLAFNLDDGGQPHGWAIPAATDIAFALGVLSLLGDRVPTSLKIFLTALAIIDDLGAVIIIALFYTSSLNVTALAGAAVVVGVLFALNRFKVVRLWPYFLLGTLLWYLVLQSGVHATLAGVILALTIPLKVYVSEQDEHTSPLHTIERGLSPWVTFLIVPLFGFANAGLSFEGMTVSALADPVPLGIAFGLFIGKQVGVFLASLTVIKLGWARLPEDASWKQFYGVSILCGIGFTMSLFIGLLAFPGAVDLQNELKLGVLAGSVVSALVGAIFLKRALPR